MQPENDSRDFAEVMAAIVDPTTDADGLAALERLFVRWHRQEHEPGDRHQRAREGSRMAIYTPDDFAVSARRIEAFMERGDPGLIGRKHLRAAVAALRLCESRIREVEASFPAALDKARRQP